MYHDQRRDWSPWVSSTYYDNFVRTITTGRLWIFPSQLVHYNCRRNLAITILATLDSLQCSRGIHLLASSWQQVTRSMLMWTPDYISVVRVLRLQCWNPKSGFVKQSVSDKFLLFTAYVNFANQSTVRKFKHCFKYIEMYVSTYLRIDTNWKKLSRK